MGVTQSITLRGPQWLTSARIRKKGRVSSAWRAPLVRLNFPGEKNGERLDAVHKVRPTLWSEPLCLPVPPFIVETVKIVRCSLLHSLTNH